MRTRALALATLLVALPQGAGALFHLAVIQELQTSQGGDTGVQFVEIRMNAGAQTFVANSVLGTFDASGAFLDDYVVPGDVSNGGAGVTWVLASAGFEAATGVAPDFVFDVVLPESAGMVCWGAPGLSPPDPASWDHADPESYVDCVAYGAYTGPTNSFVGTPTPLEPAGHSLFRVAETHDSANDFTCADPANPTNNAGAEATIAATTPCPACGNGVVDPGEECDDGDFVCGPTCDPLTCTVIACGNGVVECTEFCDDGNTVDDDGCPNECTAICVSSTIGQNRCVLEMNRKLAATWKVAGKLAGSCLKGIARGKLAGTLAECVGADAKGKLGKARAKTAAGEAKRCNPADAPPFGYTSADGVSDAVEQGSSDLNADLFGAAPVADAKADREAARCQLEVAKAAAKLGTASAKAFAKAKKSFFRSEPCGSGLALALAAGPAIAGDEPAHLRARLEAKIVKKCPTGDLSAHFGSGVDASSAVALGASAMSRTLCHLCRSLNQADGLAIACDDLDDGVTNASCPDAS